MFHWISLTDLQQVFTVKEESYNKPQVLFKHSTRCGISTLALKRIENAGITPDADFYFLDIIRFRNISNQVANDFKVDHESPQLLLIRNGTCVYNESHLGVDMQELVEQISYIS
jgi:bacillithiol system protein YtxJ